jgi:hypothetical protein
MPAQDKPYRVYRGGRVKGRVPLARETSPSRTRPGGTPPAPAAPGTAPRRPRRKRRWIVLGLVLLLALVVVWAVAGYLSVSSGVSQANERVPTGVRRQLTAPDGLLVSNPSTILVLGTDGGSTSGREGANRSDSIMLIRTDPGKRRLAFLSIPRDLQVEIPEVGLAKINAANQFGGPALALRTVKDLTGLDVNHVIFVDFDRFDRDTQLRLMRREVAGHDLLDAQLLARLLRADTSADESSRRGHRAHAPHALRRLGELDGSDDTDDAVDDGCLGDRASLLAFT